jgi:hypothetical protein
VVTNVSEKPITILRVDGGVGSSETLVTIYKATQHHNPKDHNPNFHHPENLRSHNIRYIGPLGAFSWLHIPYFTTMQEMFGILQEVNGFRVLQTSLLNGTF